MSLFQQMQSNINPKPPATISAYRRQRAGVPPHPSAKWYEDRGYRRIINPSGEVAYPREGMIEIINEEGQPEWVEYDPDWELHSPA